MSELKVIQVPKMTHIFGYVIGVTEYYKKSEADKYIADLKDTQRWHKFCKEKPSEDMMGEEFIVNNGQYSTIAEWGEGYWENDPFCGSKICDEVVWWKYLDKPEEVK